MGKMTAARRPGGGGGQGRRLPAAARPQKARRRRGNVCRDPKEVRSPPGDLPMVSHGCGLLHGNAQLEEAGPPLHCGTPVTRRAGVGASVQVSSSALAQVCSPSPSGPPSQSFLCSYPNLTLWPRHPLPSPRTRTRPPPDLSHQQWPGGLPQGRFRGHTSRQLLRSWFAMEHFRAIQSHPAGTNPQRSPAALLTPARRGELRRRPGLPRHNGQ